MPAKRRRFSRQFKAEAVQLVVEHDRPIAEVAREFQLNETTLGNWVKAWRAERPESEPEQSPVERARVAEVEDELRRLRMETSS